MYYFFDDARFRLRGAKSKETGSFPACVGIAFAFAEGVFVTWKFSTDSH